MELILASTSPRRRELLQKLGYRFTACSPGVDEGAVAAASADRPPEELARELARQKARAVFARHPDAAVLGADTVVALGEHVFGKPSGPEQAQAMLTQLSGREHRVCTGVTVCFPAGEESGTVTTTVRFFPLTQEEIARYVASGEPLDKAGAYGIQGLGALLVQEIRGDYFAVMGLPVARVARILGRIGVFPWGNGGKISVK